MRSEGPLKTDYFERQRQAMVRDLRRRGIRDERVLEVMGRVPRHLFVPEEVVHIAYGDHPLPISAGQTISQPYIVALMTQALQLDPAHRVLEIGTGSGYQTAILAELAREVYTIERFPQLLEGARQLLTQLGYTNIHYRCGNGTVGWPEHAPYDRIIATGSVPEVPRSLVRQLADPGRLVIPVGGRQVQTLVLVKKEEGAITQEELIPCSFLPLVGKEGWSDDYEYEYEDEDDRP